MKYSIKAAQEEDVALLYDFYNQIKAYHINNFKIIKNNDTVITDSYFFGELINTYLLFYQDNVIGFFRLVEYSTQSFINYTFILIDPIFVVDDWRGKGVGKFALNEIEKIANKKEFQALLLNVWTENTTAVSFYDKYGFGDIKNMKLKVL